MGDDEPRSLSSYELRSYNGKEQGLIYIAIKGELYDVTKSRHLYGPGGPYHVFAGKEIARALALFSVNGEDCIGDLDRLDEQQLDTLEEWIQKFRRKYPIVGRLNDSILQRIVSYFFPQIL